MPFDKDQAVATVEELFRQSCPTEQAGGRHPELVTSSYAGGDNSSFARGEMFASASSFVRGTLEAWGQHQHLELRPDEVWFEVLAQVSFYMKKRAGAVRDYFAEPPGRRRVRMPEQPRRSYVADTIRELKRQLDGHVAPGADWLAEWLLPGFSTTTLDEELTSLVLALGSMEIHFTLKGDLNCGLPSVRLLGTEADWVRLCDKLGGLGRLGPEAAASPEPMVSGWITGFHFWHADGTMVIGRAERVRLRRGAVLGGVRYRPELVKTLPISYTAVPVDDDLMLLAGNLGVWRIDGEAGGEASGHATAQPVTGWFLYRPLDRAALPASRWFMETEVQRWPRCPAE